MKTLWVILNDDKSAVLEVFQTELPGSKVHWEKFYQHKPGNVFCHRVHLRTPGAFDKKDIDVAWYFNYFYWEDISRWGYGDPSGIAWSACMAVPEILKMLELIE